MDLSINGTLIVQIFNFCVAFFFLRRWLIAPAVTLLLEEREYTQTQEKHCYHLRQNIARTQEATRARAATRKKELQALVPPLDRLAEKRMPTGPSAGATFMGKENLVEDYTAYIIKGVHLL